MSNRSASAQSILQRREGATLWLTLNRPEKRNAMDDNMLVGLKRELGDAFADDALRSIVITGTGNTLSAGRDRKHLGGPDQPPVHLDDGSLDASANLFTDLLNLLLNAPKPVVAAVRGFAIGGGQALSLACDFVVAESDAQFGNVEIAYGFPAALNAVLLSRHLGRRMALEIALTGTLRSAGEYQRLGLVNRLCEPGTLEAATREFCELLNQRAPWAVRRTKTLMQAAEDAPLASAMQLGNQLNELLRIDGSAARTYESGGSNPTALQAKAGKR